MQIAHAAKQREWYILNYLYAHPNWNPTMRSIWSEEFRTAEFQELCNDGHLSFDWIRVTLLDLKAAGLIHLDKGWELTERGSALVSVFKFKGTHKLIYLASPWTTDDTAKQQRWLDEVQRSVDYCFKTQPDLYVFSPILYTVPIEKRGVTPIDPWVELDFYALECATELWVLMSEDWEASEGIAKEIDFATQHGIPIEYKTLDDILALPDIPF